MNNIFQLPNLSSNEEIFETIISNNNILIEKIISTGQITSEGEWYDQDKDEWVILLQGEAKLSYFDGSNYSLKSGDYLLIPAHQKHRVEYTSIKPPCIWLAIHGFLQG